MPRLTGLCPRETVNSFLYGLRQTGSIIPSTAYLSVNPGSVAADPMLSVFPHIIRDKRVIATVIAGMLSDITIGVIILITLIIAIFTMRIPYFRYSD